MRVILFGATGMVGQGVLRVCLEEPSVERVLTVGRRATGTVADKVRELVPEDMYDLSPIADDLTGYDACFFCLGVSSAGMPEERYRRITYDLTLGAAQVLAEANPDMAFVYVSGMGTDSTEHGRVMWARVKGATENALLRLPLRVYLFRPGYIHPAPGTISRTRWYRVVYAVAGPLYPVLRRLFPRQVTTAERLGRAMLEVARDGHPSTILYPRDINAVAA